MFGPGGRLPTGAAVNLPKLRIGLIVHLTDRKNCIPFLIDIVNGGDEERVGGKGSIHPNWMPMVGIPRDPRPDRPPKVTLLTGPEPTWHHPQECPWGH